MGLFSILPEAFAFIEALLVRTFLVLAAIILGPWILLLVYDVLLYIWRTAAFELAYLRGRAGGRRRPRAPSLTSRPDGHRRQISLPGLRGR